MKESVKDIMRELDGFPDELAYSEDKWEKALEKIELFERQQGRKRGLAAVLLLLLASSTILVLISPNHAESVYSSRPNLDLRTDGEPQSLILPEEKDFLRSEAQEDRAAELVTQQTNEDEAIEKSTSLSREGQVLKTNNLEGQNRRSERFSERKIENVLRISGETKPQFGLEDIGQSMRPMVSKSWMLSGGETSVMESLSGEVNLQNIDKLRHGLPRTFVWLEGSFTLYQDYGRKKGYESQDYGFSAGLGHRLDAQWSLFAGLRYVQVSKPGGELREERRGFGYGNELLTRLVTPKRASYLGVPLCLEYRSGSRIGFGIGMGVDYLLQTHSQLSLSRSVPGHSEQLVRGMDLKGFTDVHRVWSTYGLLNIDYWLSDTWSVGLSSQIGLSDMSVDKKLGLSERDPNNRVAFGLRKVMR